MKKSILHDKTIDFAAKIVNFYEDFLLHKKITLLQNNFCVPQQVSEQT